MYTHFRLGHTRKMKYNPCFKRGYLLVGELRHQHRKQLGISVQGSVWCCFQTWLVWIRAPTFPTYIFFKIAFASSARLLQYTQFLQHQLPLALPFWWGRGRGSFFLGALSQPQEYCLLLTSAIPVFFRVLFTSYWAMPHYYSPLLQLINLYINLSLFK